MSEIPQPSAKPKSKAVAIKALEKFSIENSLSEGWECTKREFWPMLGVLAVAGILPTSLGLIFFLCSFLVPHSSSGYVIWTIVAAAISGIVNIFVDMGLLNVQLKVVHGERARVADLFSRRGVVINYFLGSVLFNILKFGGLLCFIVPGVIVTVALPFYSFFIVDKGLGPVQALKASWVLTRGARLDYALAVILFHVMRSIASMLFFIGVIPAHMVVLFSTAYIYRQLLSRTPISEFTDSDIDIQGLSADNKPVNVDTPDSHFSAETLHDEELKRFDAELQSAAGADRLSEGDREEIVGDKEENSSD